ncbi:MAG: hypothetical protein ACLR76_10340 [Alistipes sp.]
MMMKRKYSALLAVAGAAVMLGAAYLPSYSRPDGDGRTVPRHVSVTDTLSGDTVNFGNRPWQEVFTDPKLQSLIEQGLSSNIDLCGGAGRAGISGAADSGSLAYVPSFTLAPSGELSGSAQLLQKTYASAVGQLEVDLFGSS